MERLICIAIGYACGLFQTAYILGKIYHIDIRKQGSGNLGSTNVLRTLGKKAGALNLLCDCLKCIAAILIVRAIFGNSYGDILPLLGDEFTLDNLKAKFKEIMSMNVKPSTNTNLLNVKFDWEGNMIDKTTGNVVEDTESIHSWEYQADTSDGTEDSSDDSGY